MSGTWQITFAGLWVIAALCICPFLVTEWDDFKERPTFEPLGFVAAALSPLLPIGVAGILCVLVAVWPIAKAVEWYRSDWR